MRRKIALIATCICVVAGGGYWYFRVFPIQKAEHTSLREIFRDPATFWKIKSDDQLLWTRAVLEGWDDKLPKGVDCTRSKYGDIAGKLITSIAYNNQVERVRSAEQAANRFEDKAQTDLANQARNDAIARFRAAEILKKEVECFEMWRESQNPSY